MDSGRFVCPTLGVLTARVHSDFAGARIRAAPAVKARFEVRSSTADRTDQSCGDRVNVGFLLIDPEVQFFRFFLGNVERAEQPVPDGKAAAEILIEMNRVAGVMHLVMGRAQKYAAQQASERNP